MRVHTDFMDPRCFLFRRKAAIYIVDVGVAAIAITDVVLALAWDKMTVHTFLFYLINL